ncbi:MAG: STAS domain-containing protein [Bacteroidales bacterium]|nr:STAS domain-containing protein [Bacteroidales bacterium]
MEIKHTKNGQVHLVELEGRLDALNNAKAESFFNQLSDDADLNILVDCEKLDFINSSGLRILIMSLKKLKKSDKLLILCNLQKNIEEVFQFSGFDNLFKIFGSKQEALNALS